MTIGERIKNRRLELNLSVDEVAAKLGKNRATVYRYEKDDIKELPITVLEPLAKVLETTPADLMGWGEEDATADALLKEYNKISLKFDYSKEHKILELLYCIEYMSETDIDMLISMAKRFTNTKNKDDN